MLHVSDIATKARFLSNTDSTSFTNANLLISFNSHYDRIIGRILSESAGSKFKHGDVNHSAFPTYDQNLVAGTQAYRIHALATGTYPNRIEPLTILGVEVANSAGDYQPLSRITLKDINDMGVGQSEYQATNGMPREYEIREGSIVLYPAPSATATTLTNGLRVFFLRNAEQLDDVTSTSVYPGIPSPWHDLLAWGAAYDYAVANHLPNFNIFLQQYDIRMEELLDFLSRKDQTEDYQISGSSINYR